MSRTLKFEPPLTAERMERLEHLERLELTESS
jgi:hypothetical protein